MKLVYLLLVTVLGVQSCIPQAPVAKELHPGIFRINNQTFYSEKVHTYLIELEDKVLLFDIPTYSNEVEAFITSFNKPVVALLSHGSCGISDATRWQREIGLKVYAHKADRTHPWLAMKPDVFFTEVPVFGKNIEIIHTPGHSAGAVCVLEKTSNSIFTGDTFYADSEGNIMDFTQERQASYENLDDRIQSCRKLLKYDFDNVYPFHHESIVNHGNRKLNEYLNSL